jgi:hypothetical protein
MITIMVDLFSLILFAEFQFRWSRGQGLHILKRCKLEFNFVTNNRYVTCQYDAKQSSEGVSLPISRNTVCVRTSSNEKYLSIQACS